MSSKHLVGALCTSLFLAASGAAQAALIDRRGGLIYDTSGLLGLVGLGRKRQRYCLMVFGMTLFGISPMSANAGYVVSSLEQYNYQTGSSASIVRSYDAFDELDDIPGVTGLTVQVNTGPVEHIAFDPFYNAYKRRQSWDSVAEMISARPEDAMIVHTLQGSPAGSVSILAPGIPYVDAVPVNPLFEIIGVNGYWTYDARGVGTFNFQVGAVDSFTIRLNTYAAGTAGSQFFYSASVADVRNTYTRIDEQHSGVLLAGAPASPLSMTFTRGLPLDGGDADPTTYGFDTDSFLELEGEFGNIFGLADAGLGDGTQKAFVYQNNTSLLLHATVVPVPAAAWLFGSGLLGFIGVARRKAA